MRRVYSQWTLCLLSILLLFGLNGVISAQIDPDPNSPQPVLFTSRDGRAIANTAPTIIDPSKTRKLESSFPPGSSVVLYASNFVFLPGEGANALRVYAVSPKGQQYRFPVLDVLELKRPTGAFAVIVQLNDEIGYFPAPENGDLQMYLTWRGLSSNKAIIGYGGNGGWDGRTIETSSTPNTSLRTPLSKRSAEYVGYKWSSDRQRFLQQATFGSTPLLDEQVRRLGMRVWLGMQFEEPYPSAANPYPNIPLKNSDANAAITSGGCGPAPVPTTPEYRICIRDHYSMYPVQTWFFREALYGDPQLRHKIAWALSQIWVISGVDTQQSSHMLAYHKILSDNAFGNYRTLMKQMTLNPGMGNYLDMMRSTKNSPNENYPREILQLFTVGLFMLNQDGTVQTDGFGNPIPTYDQDRINNFTKVFTGWRDCRQAPPACPNSVVGTVDYKDPMELVTGNHDVTAKSLFNYPGAPSSTINACVGCNSAAIATYANNSLDQALDNIFNHPNVGPFVSKLLIQHLVESDPTPAYVGRVAAVFNNNGFGVRGDLKAVVRAILLDPEARGDVKTDPNFGKLREPVQLITNVLKATNVKSFDLTQNSDGSLQPLWGNLTQNPFNSPTVFNYFPADYVIPGTTLLGPEFGIMTTGTSIARANFANTILFSPNSLNVSEDRPLGTKIDVAEYQAAATADSTGNQLVELLNQRMMNNRMSSDMRSKIITAVQAIASSNPLLRAQNAIYLVATSSQFQVQR
jgi:uncharacterized protein (DUF1800 family)